MSVFNSRLRKKIQEKFTINYYLKRKDFTPIIILPIFSIGLIYGIGWLINKPIDSTESSLGLYTKISDVMSRIEVGMNRDDYNKQMQELNVKINNFKLDSDSIKVRNGANILAVSSLLIKANDSMLGPIWYPKPNWTLARDSYNILENCRLKGEGCFNIKQSTELQLYTLNNMKPEIKKALEDEKVIFDGSNQ
jgi:hypothetical protein